MISMEMVGPPGLEPGDVGYVGLRGQLSRPHFEVRRRPLINELVPPRDSNLEHTSGRQILTQQRPFFACTGGQKRERGYTYCGYTLL